MPENNRNINVDSSTSVQLKYFDSIKLRSLVEIYLIKIYERANIKSDKKNRRGIMLCSAVKAGTNLRGGVAVDKPI